MGRHDRRPFVAAPPSDPLERLVRIRPDGSMESVAAGSLASVPRIYCAVHGWAPGSQLEADLIRARTGREARAWDDGMVDLYGFAISEAFMPMLTAIAQQDPDAAVLWFSWVDDSATAGEIFAGRDSLLRTHVNGSRLVAALVGACGDQTPALHLIGHSHGCVVSTHAALSLPWMPHQLTLLDCPEDWISRAGGAAGKLVDLLPRLDPGRGGGRILVESYASFFGRPYHRHPGLSDVVDVRLAGALRRRDARGAVGDAHEYALDWYASTVSASDPKAGFAWSLVAAQRPQATARTGGPFDPETLESGYVVFADRSPVVVSRRRDLAAPARFDVIPIDLEPLELTPESPDVLISVALPPTDLIDFDYRIEAGHERTRLEVAVGRTLAFVGGAGVNRVPRRGRYVRVPHSDGSLPVIVQLRLCDPGDQTTVVVTDLRAVRSGRHAGGTPWRDPKDNYGVMGTAYALVGVGVAVGVVGTVTARAVGRSMSSRLARR